MSQMSYLVPTDFSESSLNALRFATDLARRTGGRVLLAHAFCLPPYVFRGLSRELVEKIRRQEEDVAARQLNEQAEAWNVEPLLVEGPADRQILQIAAQRRIDRIVMGSHGHRGMNRLLLGSIAEAVVRESSVPVLTVRREPPSLSEGGPAVILCAVDFDESTPYVLELAKGFAGEVGATLELVHAYGTYLSVIPGYNPILVRDLELAVAEASGNALQRLATEWGASGYHVETGDAGKAILRVADRVKPLAVVLGTHGRRGASRVFLGSVAEWVLRRSDVPVLTARVPELGARRT